jgi:hypothetical protein
MNIMKARIIWFPERLSYIDFDSLQDKIDWDQEQKKWAMMVLMHIKLILLKMLCI